MKLTAVLGPSIGQLKRMPWVVLAGVLGVTTIVAFGRADALNKSRDTAIEMAEGHFQDVLLDTAQRARATSDAYERVLVGAIYGLESPVSPTEVGSRMAALTSTPLPGSLAFLVVPSGDGPVWIDPEAQISDQIHHHHSAPVGLWSGVADADEDVVMIGYTNDSGDTVAAVAAIAGLFEWQECTMTRCVGSEHTADHRHNILVAFSPVDPSRPAPLTLEVLSPNDAVRDTAGHDHAGTKFSSHLELSMFGEPWIIEIEGDEDFFAVPPSREVLVGVGLGILLSLSLFGLIYFLVRRLEAESQRRTAEERFMVGFNSSLVGVAVLDSTGGILEVNQALEQLMNRSALDLKGTPMVNLVAESARSHWTARVLQTDHDPHGLRAEVQYEPDPDRTVWVDEAVTFMPGEHGEHNVLLQLSDVTEQRSAREELQRRVLQDDLTGLANRTLLEDRCRQAVHRFERSGSITAVMFIDVDHFKAINDRFGHRVADRLLAEFASRLQSVTKEEDTIARFSGDEFVMLCEALPTQTEVFRIAERVQAVASSPFGVSNRSISITTSIGIAVCRSGDDVETLLRDSGIAMYQAKEHGRGRAVLFESEMRDGLIEQLQLEREVINALEADEFDLYYQPMIEIADHQIVGFEGLIRWNHPERGVLAPAEFLPTATRLGLLPTIDAWALSTATRQLATWTRELSEAADWFVAVNAAPENFEDPAYPATVTELISRSGIVASRITIELTEDAILTNTDTAIDVIKEVRRFGVRVAMDDFGTGYSSLSQLAALDLDVLKVDRSHVADLEQSPFKEIVQSVVDLARSLGMRTVAEGVETEEHLSRLQAMGADRAQGYFIAPPLPLDQVPVFVASHKMFSDAP